MMMMMMPIFVVVKKVVDGDTVHVIDTTTKKKHKIRINGIDAPEISQSWGAESKRHLETLVNPTIDKKQQQQQQPLLLLLSNDGEKDRYGRLLGKLFLIDLNPGNPKIKDIQLLMLRGGHAWWYSKYDNTQAYSDAFDAARAEGVGLWSDSAAAAAAIPPWEYRRRHQRAAKIANMIIAAKLGSKETKVFLIHELSSTFSVSKKMAQELVRKAQLDEEEEDEEEEEEKSDETYQQRQQQQQQHLTLTNSIHTLYDKTFDKKF